MKVYIVTDIRSANEIVGVYNSEYTALGKADECSAYAYKEYVVQTKK